MKQIVCVLLASLLSAGCGGNGMSKRAAPPPDDAPIPAYTYRVKNSYPHDGGAFTQGLYWDGGFLYEGTGEYGGSSLRRVELETGTVLQEAKLTDDLFGEGIARVGDRIYQLTWRNGRALVYDAESFRKLSEFRYTGEGWGLTTDGAKLYMSDGTSRIRVLDPETFGQERTITVARNGESVAYLNELEWIDGEIWANVFMTDEIVRIDPATGGVTGTIDLTGILPSADRTPQTDVLNGIAWDSATGRIFVTGKNWKKLFEIELVRR